MGKAVMMGTFTCRDGKAGEMETVLASMVEAAKGEPGIEIYSYHQGQENTFWFFALLSDKEALAAHGQTEAMRKAMASFSSLVSEPPRMMATTPIAALGLSL